MANGYFHSSDVGWHEGQDASRERRLRRDKGNLMIEKINVVVNIKRIRHKATVFLECSKCNLEMFLVLCAGCVRHANGTKIERNEHWGMAPTPNIHSKFQLDLVTSHWGRHLHTHTTTVSFNQTKNGRKPWEWRRKCWLQHYNESWHDAERRFFVLMAMTIRTSTTGLSKACWSVLRNENSFENE